jgi:type II secretory pathway pseudopilin PulG
MNKIRRHPLGFSMVEVLLYMAVLSIIGGVAAGFMIMSLQVQIKTQTIQEVEYHGDMIMRLLGTMVRQSASITVPSVGATEARLEGTIEGTDHTFIARIADGVLYFSVDGREDVLTSPLVRVTDFQVRYLGADSDAPRYEITLTIERYSLSNRSEYAYAQTFTTVVTPR